MKEHDLTKFTTPAFKRIAALQRKREAARKKEAKSKPKPEPVKPQEDLF